MSDVDYTEMQRLAAESGRPCQHCMLLRSECDFCRIKREAAKKSKPDPDRIEFIRRAYLARLATVARPEDLSVYDEKGDGYQGRWALRYLAEQDWEAVREL